MTCDPNLCFQTPNVEHVTVGPGWSIDPNKKASFFSQIQCRRVESSGGNLYCEVVSFQQSSITCTAPNTHVLCTNPESLPTPTL